MMPVVHSAWSMVTVMVASHWQRDGDGQAMVIAGYHHCLRAKFVLTTESILMISMTTSMAKFEGRVVILGRMSGDDSMNRWWPSLAFGANSGGAGR